MGTETWEEVRKRFDEAILAADAAVEDAEERAANEGWSEGERRALGIILEWRDDLEHFDDDNYYDVPKATPDQIAFARRVLGQIIFDIANPETLQGEEYMITEHNVKQIVAFADIKRSGNKWVPAVDEEWDAAVKRWEEKKRPSTPVDK